MSLGLLNSADVHLLPEDKTSFYVEDFFHDRNDCHVAFLTNRGHRVYGTIDRDALYFDLFTPKKLIDHVLVSVSDS